MANHDTDDDFYLQASTQEVRHNDHDERARPEHGNGDAIAVVPFTALPASTMSVTRARREMKALAETMKAALAVLKKLELGERATRSYWVIDALVSGATDLRLPLTDTPQVDALRHRASIGEFDNRASLALDELEDALQAVDASLGTLTVVSVLDEPLPSKWSNLPALDLARKLNVLGHTLMRGRIPGVNV